MREINSQEIELVFENCEAILIDMWAIRSLRLETDGEIYDWDKDHKKFSEITRLKYFKLEVDLDETKYFHHTNRLITTETVQEDGEQCIDRLIKSDDLCSIIINDKDFQIPWKDEFYSADLAGTQIRCVRNLLQKNTKVTTKANDNILTIEVDRNRY